MFGSMIGGYISDKIGRKYSIILGGFLMLLATMSIPLIHSYSFLLINSLANGISIGILFTSSTTYMIEIYPNNFKEGSNAIYWLIYSLGGVYVFITQYFLLSGTKIKYFWRYFCLINVLISLILL